MSDCCAAHRDWEPWMAALGRLAIKYKITRFPDDVERAFEGLMRLTWSNDTLHKYGRHHDNCEALKVHGKARRHRHCTCGFIAARHVADSTFDDCKQCGQVKYDE